jgi:hypothetical protein
VTLTFIEEIQHTAGSYGIAVKNSAGQSVTSGTPTIGSDSMSLSIALKPNLPNDTYTVVWSNLSVDGDALTDEQFSFTVGTAVTAPSPTSMPADMSGGTAHTHDEPTPATALAQAAPATTGLIVIAMDTQHDSGVSGRAEMFPADGGTRTRIDVYLSGMEPGTSHMTHVHNNMTCNETPGSHAADLNNVVAGSDGSGMSSTTIDVPFATIANGTHVILSHVDANPQGDKTTIACGDIPAQPAAVTATLPTGLPQTGVGDSTSPSRRVFVVIAVLALVGTMIAGAGRVAATKRNG